MNERALAAILREHVIDIAGLARFCDTPVGALYTLPIPIEDALRTWRTLRALTESTGYWPVISPHRAVLGYDDAAIIDLVAYLQSDALARVIAIGEQINPVAWLEEQLAEDVRIAVEEGEDREEYRVELEGTWPATAETRTWFTIAEEATVELHLLPTTVPWHVPAFYRYGGTSTPLPEEHVALLKYWSESYGAGVLGYRGDLLEMYVSRPPQSRDDALILAWQHYAYCHDVVIQGAGSVAALAATLLNGTAWHFWWD